MSYFLLSKYFYSFLGYNLYMKIVVKLGSSLVTSNNGVDIARINSLATEIGHLNSHHFVIVTSGAIATGMQKLGLTEKPRKDGPLMQALAAIGQSDLIRAYEDSFGEKIIAQVLLTNADFSDHTRYTNIRNTLNALISKNVIPIINENDTVTAMESKKIAFNDNDALAAHVAAAIDADLLIILTNVDGLFDKNPSEKNAKLIKKVEKISDSELGMCLGTSALGSGGMLSKVRAAKIATEAGIKVVVCNGTIDKMVRLAFNEEIGTVFMPSFGVCSISEKKHWIAFASESKGQISVNEKAMSCALNKECGIEITDVLKISGDFAKNDVVVVTDDQNTPLCKGIVNFSSEELKNLKGKSKEQLLKLGHKNCEAISSSDLVPISL